MRKRSRRSLTSKNIFITLMILTGTTAIGFLFELMGLEEINVYTLFILGILLTAVVTASRTLSMASSAVGLLIFNFLFASPRYSVEAYNFGYPMDFIILIGVSLLVSSLASNSERMAYRTNILLETDQLFLKATGMEEIVSITAGQLNQLLDRPVVFYAPQGEGLSAPRCFHGAPGGALDEKAAAWTRENRTAAGARTARFAQAEYLYWPVATEESLYGVLGVAAGERPLTEMEGSLVRSLLSECALTLERDFYDQKRREAAAQMRDEKLRADLLRSISHDLRTPLTSISGSAGLLHDQDGRLSPEQKAQLILDIRDDALWLLGTVENLLAVTRMEDGRMTLHLRPELMSEVISEAMERTEKYAGGRQITAQQEDDLLMARIDARLIVQVIVNLIDNAIKYTPEGTTIRVCARAEGGQVIVSVADDGPGIPHEAKQRVFEMFYTTAKGTSDGRRGLGLGLALCRSIISAHGGSIRVADNAPHGAVFTFTLQEERIKCHG